ncbi:chromosome segregation ATPase [Caldanaerobacter subterraneus subsp. tengcongensis MB4]|uniref:Predicted Transcriptional regulator n=1 Tax=Caldanaerobacter subterraneus subsp. tengcongensis (strain DSM 15242 / JCM 11007 / NBRC 100824 / MB4) TaxID=273068 RepID=Q8R5Q8_CALS4|nr:ParB N-terminal domain-containing protein [Caldanaerobacter subterraneus]AAM25243.1 predicted Transcriptional regulator [Caldanaerobacter subterraneus subsp. tengcongensis MB4]MCS3915160.1 chromosome segregation ATPase [Caldanaerobacter subterraneus subsp. tengcongensis MB4]
MGMIKIELLKEHPRNKEFFDDIEGDRWQEFVESIRTSGIIVPLIVTQDYVVISGNQRLKAAKELGLKEVPCEVRTYEDRDGLTKEDWMLKDLIETNLRQRGIGNLNPMKLARCILELERIYGIKVGKPQNQLQIMDDNSATVAELQTIISQKELAEIVGLKERQLRGIKKLNDLIPELQILVEQGKLSSSAGEQLAYLEPEQQKELFDVLGESIAELKRNEVHEVKKQLEEYKRTSYSLQETVEWLKKEKEKLEHSKRELEEKLKNIKPKIIEKEPDDYRQLKEALKAITEQSNHITEKLNQVLKEKEELEKKNQEYLEGLKKLEEMNKTLKKERDKFIELSREYERSFEEEKWGFELTHALSNLSQEVAGRIAAVEVLLEKRNPVNEKNTQMLLERAIRTLEEGIRKLSKWRVRKDEVIEVEYTTYSGSDL